MTLADALKFKEKPQDKRMNNRLTTMCAGVIKKKEIKKCKADKMVVIRR